MDCSYNPSTGTQEAVLTFSRDQLQYDIENLCYIEGRAMPSTTEPHTRHLVQEVGADGNNDRITRILNLCVARCREALYQHTKYAVDRPVLNNDLESPGVYGIVLSLPLAFSQTSLNLLKHLIHEYLVVNAVAEWIALTDPARLPLWRTKAEEAESEILRCIQTRTTGLRRRCHPF